MFAIFLVVGSSLFSDLLLLCTSVYTLVKSLTCVSVVERYVGRRAHS